MVAKRKSVNEDTEKLVLQYTIQNALQYHGKANTNSVLGKLLADHPELKEKARELRDKIDKQVENVNKLSQEEQEKKLASLGISKQFEKKKGKKEKSEKDRKEDLELPELQGAQKGKVIMRFEPSPTGALHIGHALIVLLNSEYCRKYNGKFILRISDTNPSDIYAPAYKLIEEDTRWLTQGKINKIIYQSDRLEIYYKYAWQLIKKGNAFVCTCNPDHFQLYINAKKACPCRSLEILENEERWKDMLSGKIKQGEAVVRIKTSLELANPALIDWPALRINESKHPRKGKKYRVWPLLNFAVPIDDALQGMTHVIRGKDQEVNTERQKYVYNYLGWKVPFFFHIGKINFLGETRVSASETREAILQGKYKGWNDIRLPFIQALKRRGIQPEALAKYAISVGPSPVDKTVSYDEFMQQIYSNNREIIDKDADRYFFVAYPLKIKVENSPKITAKLSVHPDFPKKGQRIFKTSNEFYISQHDLRELEDGKIYRLMNLFNFKKLGRMFKFHSEKHSPELKAKLIHWLPADEKQFFKTQVLMPNGEFVHGLAETQAKKIKLGQVVQFERFGFVCRQKDAFWFGHK